MSVSLWVFVLLGALAYVLATAAQALLLVFVAALFACAVRSVALRLPGPPWLTRSLVVGAVTVLAAGLLFWLGTRFQAQADEFLKDLPTLWQGLRQQLTGTRWGQLLLQGAQSSWDSASLLGRVRATLATTVISLGDGLLVLVLTLFLVFDADTYSRGFLRLLPSGRRRRAREVLSRLGSTLARWTQGRLATMALTGTLTSVGLWLVGLPFALLFGVLVGVLGFIPNLGPLLAGLPAGLVALQSGPAMLGKVALVYFITQLLDGFVLTPLVNRRTVQVPPVLGLTAQLVCGLWFGTLGMITATPLAATGLVLVHELYLKDVLGDEEEEP